jgi:2-polyprenyl-3-methyl-5-hydroxy-6-metoxy-1,4-benzoquinol methylase
MYEGEEQYKEFQTRLTKSGTDKLGLMTSWLFEDDPKKLVFTFARYKFAAKMLTGCDRVLEVGCADGVSTRLIRQVVKTVVAIDFDSAFIENAKERMSAKWPIDFRLHDILTGPVKCKPFDGAVSLDVLEHINSNQEDQFITNVASSLTEFGTFIVGMPSLESQPHASALSKAGHVNCKKQEDLGALLEKHFQKVFTFGMNDEVLHTGYGGMSHYNIAIGVGPRCK